MILNKSISVSLLMIFFIPLSIMKKDVVLGLNTFQYCPKCGSKKFNKHTEKSNKCDSCGFVYFLNPSAAVAAFICDEDGRLLLCRRAKNPQKGTLDLPGGFVDSNETAEEALKRELQEELNVVVENTTYLFSFPNVYRYSDLDIPTLDLFFECKIDTFASIEVADDVASAEFYHLNDICLEEIGLNSIRKAVAYYIVQKKK